MKLSKRAMGLGLKALNRVAGASLIDRLGLRNPTEQVLYQGAKAGFGAMGLAARGVRATRKLVGPARLEPARSSELFDLTPTDEQQMMREAVQDFALGMLRPAAPVADADGVAPAELVAEAQGLGIGLLSVPEALGGAGTERSAVTNVLVAEALAQGDMGLAVACLAPSSVPLALSLWGDAQQQAAYLEAFATEHAPVAALAIQEAHALFDPFRLRCTARRSGDDYILRGDKHLVARAGAAELFVVAAMVEGEPHPALFIVEAGMIGVSVTAEPAMGLRAAEWGRLHLSDVRLPETARLAGVTPERYRDCVQLARLAWCALSVGTAQAALDYLIPYVNERKAFGEPISHRQAVAFPVADISIELDAMRLLTWRGASRAEQGMAFAEQAALARRLCADKGARIGSDAVQLLGGHGFIKEHPVERWYRDLRVAGVLEGVVLI